MSNIVLFSHVLLWLGFAVLVVVNLAMLRQFGVLFERVAPAGALAMNSQIAAGDAAPVLALTSMSGDTLAIGDVAEKSSLIFFLSPSCAVCSSLLPLVKKLGRQSRGVEVIYASAGDDVQAHETFIGKYDLPRQRYVISDQLGMAFGVSKLPYAVLLDAEGRISAFGLVNSREHLESLFEAQDMKVASLQDYIKQNEKTDGGQHAGQKG